MTPGADICRQINLTSDFVDSNGKAEVLGGIFLNRERVVPLEATDKIIGAGGILVLDTEVIDDKSESHAVGGVAEEIGGAGLQVTMSSQTVDEIVFGDISCVW